MITPARRLYPGPMPSAVNIRSAKRGNAKPKRERRTWKGDVQSENYKGETQRLERTVAAATALAAYLKLKAETGKKRGHENVTKPCQGNGIKRWELSLTRRPGTPG